MKKYFRVDFTGVIPAIENTSFHPRCFHATQEEMDEVYDKLKNREDEFKIIGIHSFDTMQELEKYFPDFGEGLELPFNKLCLTDRKNKIMAEIEKLKAKGLDYSIYKEMLAKKVVIHTI